MRRFFFAILFLLFNCGLLSAQEAEYTAKELYGLYLSAQEKGDFDHAEAYLLRLLKQNKDLPDYNRILVYNALGWIYYETSRFNAALRHYLQADSLSAVTGTETTPLKISIHNNLGLLYNWLGEYTLARDHFERAYYWLDSLTERDSVYFHKLSMLQFNRGVLMFFLGEHTAALSLLRDSEKIKKTHGHAYLGSVYYNLARVYEALRRTDSAAFYYRKAISRWSSEYHREHYQLANIYQDFGLMQIASGKRQEGLDLLEAALNNYLENYGSRHPLTAACYEKLGLFYLDQSEYERALNLIQKALITATHHFNNESPWENPGHTEGLHDLTLLKILQSKVRVLEQSAAESAGERSTELLILASRTNRLATRVLYRIQGSYLTGESRTYLIARQKGVFETGIRIHQQLWSVTGKSAYLDSAYLDAAKGKANELLLERRLKEWLYLESLPDTIARSVNDLKLQADHLSHLIQTESQEVDPDSSLLAEWQNQLYQLRDSFRSELDRLQGTHPLMSQFEFLTRHLTMEGIRKKIRRDETLIEYFVGDSAADGTNQLHVFVVADDATHYQRSVLDGPFREDLEVVMENLHEFDPLTESRGRFDSLMLALNRLYRQLFEPFKTHLAGEKIILVPDGPLAYLPFDVLLAGKPVGPAMNYSGQPYLIHEYQISYAYHSILTRSRHSLPILFPDLSAWAPTYERSGSAQWSHLEGAEDEVSAVVKLTGGSAWRGELERNEVVDLLQSDGIIHLATHAVAPESPWDSPYFVLSPEEGSSQSGRLYDYEIQSLAVPSPLVVLSGCETAGGYEQKGEGVLNLSRSFLQAGALSVVHSLWPVVDPNASQIMVDFYRELKQGKSRKASLRRAKLNYLQEAPPSYTHPHYWATFQVTGDPGPVRLQWWKLLGGFALVAVWVLAVILLLVRNSYFASWRRSFKRARASSR